MPTPDRIPVQIPPEKPQPQPYHRHHSARYIAHRVRESLATRVSKKICIVFLSLLLILGIISFILWIALRPHRPRVHLHDFSINALDQPSGFENAQIHFNVTARNSNQHIGIYYYSMEGLVYYRDQMIGSMPLKDPFYQEPKTTTVLDATLSGATLTVGSQRWGEFLSDREKGKVVFRLEIRSPIRFRVSTWDTKKHTMHATCQVEVGSDGEILPISKKKRCPTYFT